MLRDWRSAQQNFFKEKVEFEQDRRIIDYFIDSAVPTYGYGSISYFLDKILDSSKICISINKFKIYSKDCSQNTKEDYDLALYDFIYNEFINSKIRYFYVKNLKGDSFNFASPTTQFFIDYII